MIDTVTSLYAQSCNNALANYRLLKACRLLTSEAIGAKRTSFFPSIIHTLNHILTVDWFYVSALEDACMGYAAFEPEIPCPQFEELEREQRSIDQLLMNVCAALSAERLERPVRLLRDKRTIDGARHRLLLHLFEHQIHHRGQFHAMLSGTNIKPPQLDEFFLDSPNERAVRADDLKDLGLSEAMIWLRRS